MATEFKLERGAAAPDVTTADDALAFAREFGVEMVDLKFTDLPGTWQHMQMPLDGLDADDFDAGLGFDGSSIRGFQTIDEPDMLLIPDPPTAIIDPSYHAKTPSLVCSVADPIARTA